MIGATIYEAGSGAIRRVVRCVTMADIEINLSEGEGWIEGEFSASTHYVRDGAAALKPARPGPWAVFDFAAGEWTDPRSPEQVLADLQAAQAEAVAKVNAAVGQVRRRFVTDIPGQDMLYLRKEAEAARWISDPEPDLADYPLIAAEIGITAEDGDQMAQIWINMADLWAGIAAQLETLRLGHIAQVEVAADQAGIEAALSAFQQALEALE